MTQLDETVAIKVLPADDAAPAGKLADVELHFTAGALEGLKLLGFTIWEGPRWQGPERESAVPALRGQRRAPQLHAAPAERRGACSGHVARHPTGGVRGPRPEQRVLV